MLPPIPPLFSLSPSVSPIRLDKVSRWSAQVVVSSQKLLVILVINQPSPPQVVEQVEVGSGCPQRLAEHDMVARQMLHASGPTVPTVTGSHGPVTQRALDRLGWLFATEMAVAMRGPLFLVA
jgi:hypothetical protein